MVQVVMIMMVEIDISGGVGVGVDDPMMVVVLTVRVVRVGSVGRALDS